MLGFRTAAMEDELRIASVNQNVAEDLKKHMRFTRLPSSQC